MAEIRAPPSRTKYKLVTSYYRLMLTISGNWITYTTPYEDWLESEPVVSEPRSDGRILHPTHPHTIVSLWGEMKCF